MHLFASDAAMASFYPIAPTDDGKYGLKFLGSAPPTPAEFTAGLAYAGGTYPTPKPQVISANNNAIWSGGRLVVSTTGVTTVNLNSFPEYATATHGALITAGLWSPSGQLVHSASIGGWRAPSVGVNQPAPTSIPINGAELTPGVSYTLEIQYAIFGAPPTNGSLSGKTFIGSAGYYNITRVMIRATDKVTVTESDFDGDGFSELLWRHASSGEFASRTSTDGIISLGAEGGGWVYAGMADVDGDRKVELVWRHTSSGLVTAERSSGGTLTLGGEGSGWTYVDVADFDGDDRAEAAWRHAPSGLFMAWCSGGGTLTLGADGGGWQFAGADDFDGDGKDEIYWFNQNNGVVQTWPSAAGGGSIVLGGEGSGWIRKGSGDFDGDGRAEIYWYHVPTKLVATWCSGGGTLTLGQEGSGWELAGVGDYDGDIKAEASWYHTGTRQVATWSSGDGYIDLGTTPGDWTIQR